MSKLSEPLLLSAPGYAQQIEMEARAVRAGVERYRRIHGMAVRRGEGGRTHAAAAVSVPWFTPLREQIVQLKRSCRGGKPARGRDIYGPLCLSLAADVQAAVTIDTILGHMLRKAARHERVTWASAASSVGAALIAELNARLAKKQSKSLRSGVRRLTPQRINWWAKKNLEDPVWSMQAAHAWGDIVLKILVSEAVVADSEGRRTLAFKRHKVRRRDGRSVWAIRMSEDLVRHMTRLESHLAQCRPVHTPMVCEPMPWRKKDTGLIEGGRITTRYPLIAKPTREQKAAMRDADLSKTFEAIADVSATPWRVNANVLRWIERFAERGQLGTPPPENPPCPPPLPDGSPEEDVRARKRERAMWYGECERLAGMRYVFHLSLSTAREYAAHHPRWWIDYSLDFRQRMYPKPWVLCPQREDIWRGACELADGKPPGDDGLATVLIHAAGVYGIKASIGDRLQWGLDHSSRMLACAADPENTVDFWGKADGGDAAWQFLAACFAVADPAARAHFPVSIDGTCSGLQHYACATMDPETATIVNLRAADETVAPNDVYTIVANEVAKAVAEDVLAGNPHARRVAGLITRKVCKQPVMTTVYGARPSGMRTQLFGTLGPALSGKPSVREINREEWQSLYPTMEYVRKKVAGAIESTSPKAAEAMAWIRSVAKHAADQGKLLRWTAPITGFPVVMRDVCTRASRVQLATGRYTFRTPTPDDGVRVGKQVDGSAPDVIHSFDAAHLVASARAARRAGIAFTPNHDCFMTHAATWRDLGRIVRAEMVGMYRWRPLLALAEEWRGLYGDIPEPPTMGEWDITEIERAANAFA